MSEIKTELKIYRVDYQCDSCGQGIMVLDSRKQTASSKENEADVISWPHKCDNCGVIKEFDKIYPKQVIQ